MLDNITVIVGPTASGKTDMGVRIAKKIDAEIISADSMQIYKYMNIGTAKPTVDEMSGVPHYLIDEIDPSQEFSVANFREKSEVYINDILSRNKKPLIVGGTGLYINALVQPWNFTKTEPNHELRIEFENIAKEKGNDYLHNMLRKVDEISAHAIHPNNVKRVVRALEVYKETGKPKSQFDLESMKEQLKYNPIIMGINLNRDTLYSRIELRIDIMIKSGLVEEVQSLLDTGYSESLVSMQGLGYKEIIKYIKGEYSFEEAIEILKRDTRHFAKRQLTWFRRDNRIKWFNIEDYKDKEVMELDMIAYLRSKEIICEKRNARNDEECIRNR
ncbi:tRNA (adenosine(37)-N6)-dimethylallyltransferase MiaA [Alkalibaculum sp. M08DMB]|uniref:tRNA dimethylallyltransferase n=1 Tax=Alkalibaculum sporogenes TaxID=2655001 RepID=A0A6A7K760_9FIRM|nr:tRNA (adenosine(37)-N6)-dimethylallyltransferase MiaA [Alkalibaculum sporogenes]MPW25216.1 tRNA (adenosine(37)-N6)-dimethylallyltransferase MiaA [Alkalibaculum sporogenes]